MRQLPEWFLTKPCLSKKLTKLVKSCQKKTTRVPRLTTCDRLQGIFEILRWSSYLFKSARKKTWFRGRNYRIVNTFAYTILKSEVNLHIRFYILSSAPSPLPVPPLSPFRPPSLSPNSEPAPHHLTKSHLTSVIKYRQNPR